MTPPQQDEANNRVNKNKTTCGSKERFNEQRNWKEKGKKTNTYKEKKSDAKPVTKYLPQGDKCSASPQATATYPKHLP